MILRAVAAPDGQMLELLAAALADSEQAKQLLIAKGYGKASMPASAAARQAPNAKE